MTPDQLEWFSNLLTNQGFAVVTVLAIFAFVAFMFWPWFTKQYDRGQERSERQALEFAGAVKGFTELISTRDQLRYTEHGQYLNAMSDQQVKYLESISAQRVEFLSALAKRDEQMANVAEALEDLRQQIASNHANRRGS